MSDSLTLPNSEDANEACFQSSNGHRNRRAAVSVSQSTHWHAGSLMVETLSFAGNPERRLDASKFDVLTHHLLYGNMPINKNVLTCKKAGIPFHCR
mmetsp:Transcript_105296/g.209291  ORF Transcript_105296/g.209291 Transcript_105296/m.209291 type:complete len:96 (+) Transcript_105296:154-441(+)